MVLGVGRKVGGGQRHGALHAIDDTVGGGRLKLGTQVGNVLLLQRYERAGLLAHRGLQASEREMRLGRPSIGRGNLKRPARPEAAARSTATPPGKPRPKSLAVLSKASPKASSMVLPRR